MSVSRLFAFEFKKELRGRSAGPGGAALSVIVGGGVIALFVYIFFGLVRGFKNMGLGSELIGLALGLIYIYLIVTGVPSAAKMLSGDDDAVLKPLPVSSGKVVFVKLAVNYTLVFLGSLVLFLPFLICYAAVNAPSVAYYVGAAAALIVLPLLSELFSALLALPYRALKRVFYRRRVLLLLIACLFLAGLFLLYGKMLVTLNALLENGRLQYLFNAANVGIVQKLVRCFVPIDFFVRIMSGRGAALSVIAIGAMSAAAILVLWFLGKAVRPESSAERTIRPASARPKSIGKALLYKEVTLILRSDGMLLGYLALIVSVPVLSYLSCGVLKSVVAAAIGRTFVFPFCLMLIILFTVVCNSYAGGSLKRESGGLSVMRTLPVALKKQLSVKSVLSSILTIISCVATGVAVAAAGIMSPGEGAAAAAAAALTGCAVGLSAETSCLRGGSGAGVLPVWLSAALLMTLLTVTARILLGVVPMLIISITLPALFLASCLARYRRAVGNFAGGEI